ncbi:MAG TPA: phosphatase PAP2 family protein [Burkholderiaceae bacterium]|nr:phosphatase PAP2 family protein [Burkholderiaceae bacterium]
MILARRWEVAVAGIGLIALLLWEWSGLDLALTRAYGSPSGFVWRDAWLTRTLLHDGGRALAWAVMALWLLTLGLDHGVDRSRRLRWIGVSLLCLLLVPALKQFAASSCPWELQEFGGRVATYVPHWRLGVHDGGPGHCFPSGHAVAAFGFFAIYFERRKHHPRAARWWLAAVCATGALFGWAQLARGAHFASHTLWTAWLCWAVCVSATLPLRLRRKGEISLAGCR